MRAIAGEVVTFSCGPLHMDEQKQDDQLEHTYNCSVPIQDVDEDLPETMDGREGCRERVRDIRADGVT